MDSGTLYARMETTLFAWWTGLAHSSAGARLIRLAGLTAALFPAPTERDVLNNAVAARHAPPRATALAALTELYQRHGVARWQLWVQEEHHALHALVRAAGLVVDTTTVAMAQDLTRTAWRPQPSLDLIRAPGGADLCGLLENAEVRVPQFRAAGAHLYAVRSAGEPASYVVSFEYAGDCGLYGVGTADRFRRRGLATALVRQALWEARERGCTSASLQATAMAERVYAALGFEALGRYVEWQYRGAP